MDIVSGIRNAVCQRDGLFSGGWSDRAGHYGNFGSFYHRDHIWSYGQHRPSGWKHGAYILCAAYHPSHNIAAYGAYHRDDNAYNNTYNTYHAAPDAHRALHAFC